MERENMVKSVGRALDVIALISMKKSGLGVTEIAGQMDINKSSVYRILATLVQYGYAEQNEETGKYRLGYKFLEIRRFVIKIVMVSHTSFIFYIILFNHID